jgi:hypothetical protein
MTARRPISSSHFSDADGNPAGGTTFGEGFAIGWQNGPTREQGSDEPVRNGAFVEEVILACRDRIDYYQQSRFACEENAEAVRHLERCVERWA